MATFKREIKKLPSEQNLRLLSSLVISLANKTSSVEDKCIAPWKAGETYQKDVSLVIYNGYIYSCLVTNKDAVFTESHWMKLADSFDELTVNDVKAMLNLSSEELANLQSLIDDTTITTTKTNSSSKIYMDIQAAIAECKDDTLKQIAKKVSGSYKIASSTSDVTSADFIYLINNGVNYDLYVLVDSTPTRVGDTSVNLDNYYTKTEVDNDFLKKSDATSTYATITTVDGKVDKTDVLTAKSDTATDEQVYSASVINKELLYILEKVYPVGSVYINVTDINPFDILGFGTWERFAQNMTLWGASDSGQVGTIKNAGLPNITGETRYISENCLWESASSGAFNGYFSNTSKKISNVALSEPKSNAYYFKFDASQSNPIYGNSTTVQPPALVVNIWKRTA